MFTALTPFGDGEESTRKTGTDTADTGQDEEQELNPGEQFLEDERALQRRLQDGLIGYEEYLQELLSLREQYAEALSEQGAPEDAIAEQVGRIDALETRISDLQTPEPQPETVTPEDETVDAEQVDYNAPLQLNTPVRDIDELMQTYREFYGEAEAQRRIVSDLEREILSILQGEKEASDEQLNKLQDRLQYYSRMNKERSKAEKREQLVLDTYQQIEDRLAGITVSFYDALINGSQDFEDALKSAGIDALRAIVRSSAAAAMARIMRPEERDDDVFDVLFGEGAQQAQKQAQQAQKGKTGSSRPKPTAAGGSAKGLSAGQNAMAGTTGFLAGQGVQEATGSKALGGLAGGLTAAGTAALMGASPLGIVLLGAGGLFGGLFASGGRPPVGKASIVGERGPEVFVPDQAGTVISHEAMRSAFNPPELPSDDSALIQEVQRLRQSTEAALDRPAKARIARTDFREAQQETREYSRQKNPRNLRR